MYLRTQRIDPFTGCLGDSGPISAHNTSLQPFTATSVARLGGSHDPSLTGLFSEIQRWPGCGKSSTPHSCVHRGWIVAAGGPHPFGVHGFQTLDL